MNCLCVLMIVVGVAVLLLSIQIVDRPHVLLLLFHYQVHDSCVLYVCVISHLLKVIHIIIIVQFIYHVLIVNDSRDRSSSPADSLYSSTKEDPFTTPVKPHIDQSRIDTNTPSPDVNQTSLNLAPTDFLRSSSAPPTSIKSVTSNDIIRLNPSRLNECEQWLWLGSEGGILYLLKVGVSSLDVASSLSIDMGSSIKCLLSHDNHVWAGLDNGQIAKFNLDSGEYTYHNYYN